MTNEEVKEVYARAEIEYELLKDRVHDQYDEIQQLKKRNKQLEEKIDKAIDYIKSNCEIIRYKNYDKIGNVDGAILLEILGDKEND